MSRINDLIAQQAPTGVPIKPLGDVVANFDSQRRPVTRSDRRAGAYPYYGANGVQDYVDEYLFDGTFLLMGEDGSVMGHDGSPVLNWASGKMWVNNHAHVLDAKSDELDLRFLFHYLQTVDISAYVTGGTQLKLNQSNLNRIPVPVPPVPVQREIVKILDYFSKLEADLEVELQAELEARRRQYGDYRRSLLVFGEDVSSRPLGKMADNLDRRRKPVTRAARNPGKIPYYGASGIVDYVSDFIFDGDYLLVSEDGANLLARSTPIAFSIKGKTWVNNHAHVLQFDTDVARRFVEIYLNSIDLTPYVTGAAQPKLNKAKLTAITVPDPSLVEKERIVVALDLFEGLVNELSAGISAELVSRHAQYEYYRDRLLTFDVATA